MWATVFLRIRKLFWAALSPQDGRQPADAVVYLTIYSGLWSLGGFVFFFFNSKSCSKTDLKRKLRTNRQNLGKIHWIRFVIGLRWRVIHVWNIKLHICGYEFYLEANKVHKLLYNLHVEHLDSDMLISDNNMLTYTTYHPCWKVLFLLSSVALYECASRFDAQINWSRSDLLARHLWGSLPGSASPKVKAVAGGADAPSPMLIKH